jgi:hypothetical protein
VTLKMRWAKARARDLAGADRPLSRRRRRPRFDRSGARSWKTSPATPASMPAAW